MTVRATLKRHGTAYGYDQGCRCQECRAAKLKKRRDQRVLGREQNRPSYVRELAHGRALKETYRGRCADCGRPTNGSNGPGSAATRCVKCQARLTGLANRGKGPVQQKLVAFLADGPRRYSVIRDALDSDDNNTSSLLHHSVRTGLVVRVSRGVYALPESRARELEAVTPLKERDQSVA